MGLTEVEIEMVELHECKKANLESLPWNNRVKNVE